MHRIRKVHNNILQNFGHIHFCALITNCNWYTKVEKLFDAP